MMPLHDAAAITVLERRSKRLNRLEKEIHAHGKIRPVEQCRFAFEYQFAHAVQMLVPAGGPHNNGNTRFGAADDIRNRRMWRGKVNDHVNLLQQFRRESAAVLVFLAGQRADIVTAFFGDFRGQRSGFSASQHKDVHANTSGSVSLKKVRCRRETTCGTSASSITKLILISEAPCEIMWMFTSSS